VPTCAHLTGSWQHLTASSSAPWPSSAATCGRAAQTVSLGQGKGAAHRPEGEAAAEAPGQAKGQGGGGWAAQQAQLCLPTTATGWWDW